MTPPQITVVYLFRKGEDPAWCMRFAEAVSKHSPTSFSPLASSGSSVSATWHVYLKGFDIVPNDLEQSLQTFKEAVKFASGGDDYFSIRHIPDEGWDLGTYRKAADAVITPYILFLNAHSEPLAPGWLSRYVEALRTHALVGATASHEGVPGVPFPNPHVRTNAFALSVELLRSLAWPIPKTKEEAHGLECGEGNLTSQVIGKGLLAGVVNRRGNIYGVESENVLRGSQTFRWGSQVDLLVADNRTRAYDVADEAGKDYLETLAWGKAQTPDKVPPTIIIPSFRKGSDFRVWDDLRLALASAAYYASECPLLVGWDGPALDINPGPPLATFEERPKGLSGPAAYNWCAERVSARHLVLMNDDAVFHPDTISRLVEDWNILRSKRQKVGFLGCRSNFVAGEANIRNPNGGNRTGVDYTSEQSILAVSTVYPVCAMIARSVFLGAGGFQPAINWYSDNLLCFDLAAKGHHHFVSRAYVHHVGMRGTRAEADRSMAEENSRSLAWLEVHRPDYFARLS